MPSSEHRIFNVPEGMPLSVFNDRYSRPSGFGELQSYEERIREVVHGNFSLIRDPVDPVQHEQDLRDTLRLSVAGVMPYSGRHLQHGDMSQPGRSMEVFTNCSTAMFSFMSLLLLLNGSGVGRDYSADSCRVDWDYMPNIRIVLDGGPDDSGDVSKGSHPNFSSAFTEFQGSFDSLREARHKYDSNSEDVKWFKVRDSREGWAEIICVLETAAYHRNHKDSLFIFDFSDVRSAGSPIKGMQNRPAQGPIPLMRALLKVATIKGAGMKPWKQALFIDHYLAACVVMGNVRRAARMSTKYWKDRDVIEFIDIKRGGHLWSSNNSILTDTEFWEQARNPAPSHARRVFEAALAAAYFDQTGEPGFINADQLTSNDKDADKITAYNYLNKNVIGFDLHPRTLEMIDRMLRDMRKSPNHYITNPCGEIALSKWGGYCVIGDIALSHCEHLDEAIDAARLMAPFLIRVNTMKALYAKEVERTNRIGVGITGIHEFAFKFFNCTFHDAISAYDYVVFNKGPRPEQKVMNFWSFIDKMRQTVEESATSYSEQLGMNVPHTFTTIKPSGTISKVMACTEGAHLPAVKYYTRNVIFPKGSDKVAEFEKQGYPIKDVSHQYHGCVVVGFPTKQPIVDLMPEDQIATAEEVGPEAHFKWVQLIETFWMGGPGKNNQVSYTLKYDPKIVSFNSFMQMVLDYQPRVRCCSVMPVTDISAYAYVPEDPIDAETYEAMMAKIDRAKEEAYDDASLECAGGACPIELKIR